MSTVALIGPDGAGKTAIAKKLLETCPLQMKYLYMGTSIESSNVALPTSRLVHRWKVNQHKRKLRRAGKTLPQSITLNGMEHRVDRRGKLGAVARLVMRVAEESYRQAVSWTYQLRGYTVLYDRHFLFDVCPSPSRQANRRLTDRIHSWFLRRIYPKPDLVIFLDAPPDVLYARKQEVSEEYLQSDREALQEKSEYTKNFVCVDATKPFDKVLTTVNDLIVRNCTRQPT